MRAPLSERSVSIVSSQMCPSESSEIGAELMKRVSKNEIVAHGETQISRINRFFNTEIPNHRTLCGFLIDEIGHVPKPGYIVTLYDIEFVIEAVDNHSIIEKVRLKKLPVAAEPPKYHKH